MRKSQRKGPGTTSQIRTQNHVENRISIRGNHVLAVAKEKSPAKAVSCSLLTLRQPFSGCLRESKKPPSQMTPTRPSRLEKLGTHATKIYLNQKKMTETNFEVPGDPVFARRAAPSFTTAGRPVRKKKNRETQESRPGGKGRRHGPVGKSQRTKKFPARGGEKTGLGAPHRYQLLS